MSRLAILPWLLASSSTFWSFASNRLAFADLAMVMKSVGGADGVAIGRGRDSSDIPESFCALLASSAVGADGSAGAGIPPANMGEGGSPDAALGCCPAGAAGSAGSTEGAPNSAAGEGGGPDSDSGAGGSSVGATASTGATGSSGDGVCGPSGSLTSP